MNLDAWEILEARNKAHGIIQNDNKQVSLIGHKQ